MKIKILLFFLALFQLSQAEELKQGIPKHWHEASGVFVYKRGDNGVTLEKAIVGNPQKQGFVEKQLIFKHFAKSLKVGEKMLVLNYAPKDTNEVMREVLNVAVHVIEDENVLFGRKLPLGKCSLKKLETLLKPDPPKKEEILNILSGEGYGEKHPLVLKVKSDNIDEEIHNEIKKIKARRKKEVLKVGKRLNPNEIVSVVFIMPRTIDKKAIDGAPKALISILVKSNCIDKIHSIHRIEKGLVIDLPRRNAIHIIRALKMNTPPTYISTFKEGSVKEIHRKYLKTTSRQTEKTNSPIL